MKYFYIWLAITLAGPLWLIATGQVSLSSDYKTANRDSAGLAPKAEEYGGAVIQAYAARAFNWRGAFASHCWLAVKPKGAAQYTVYQIVGWRNYHNLPALAVMEDLPDRNWFDAAPELILDIRGEKAEALIPKVAAAVESYPYAAPYTLWPGPNSNTFPAYVARQVPELGLVMPANAVGKDFLGWTTFFAPAPSGTGYQASLFGVLGVTLAKKEGIEINLLGVIYGVRFSPFGVVLPGIN